MAEHTTMKIGGPADLFARPVSVAETLELCRFCRAEGLPWFVLGGGANILVADRGVRGMVIDLGQLSGVHADGTVVEAGAGAPMSAVSAFAAEHALTGLEFIYAMPGSLGGSVWMNARCYGTSLSDVIESVSWVDMHAEPVVRVYTARAHDFAYKKSPFQALSCVIIGVRLRLAPGQPDTSRRLMEEHRTDRVVKGHFLFPSAGSAFKNDPAFGQPTGKIIDGLGLRGWKSGGAAIAEYHGNIVINTGSATARDVLNVLRHAERAVHTATGHALEREVILVGDWAGIDTTPGR